MAVPISQASEAQPNLQVLSKFRAVTILMLVIIWKNMFSCSDHTRSLLWLLSKMATSDNKASSACNQATASFSFQVFQQLLPKLA